MYAASMESSAGGGLEQQYTNTTPKHASNTGQERAGGKGSIEACCEHEYTAEISLKYPLPPTEIHDGRLFKKVG